MTRPTCTSCKRFTTELGRCDFCHPTVPTEDPVNHPSHYKSEGMEVINVIESFKLPYHLGNCIKYILRAGKKDPSKLLEDLKKAQWYLSRYIDTLTK